MASTVTLESVVEWARAIPDLVPVLSLSGYAEQPALTIATDVLAEMLSPPFAWKWNRRFPAPVIGNPNQQDYATAILDLAWLESCTRTNLSTRAVPKPVYPVSAVRELSPTFLHGAAGGIAWIPNAQAAVGSWVAKTTYAVPAEGSPAPPSNPLLQIRDSNGNLQLVTGGGTTGASEPAWNTTVGATTADGTVIWTMLPPDGIAFRLDRVPAGNDQLWSYQPLYQAKSSAFTSLNQTIQVPDDLAWVFREGFAARCYAHGGNAMATARQARFITAVRTALKGADRELASFGIVPAAGLMDR